jgi:hypothetical protein
MDISTSDGLLMAMEVDPTGDRTIGVLTKVDIMDRGTNCKAILMNEEIPLKNGYVALKNRSQQEIMDGLSIKDALVREKEYFINNPIYRFMAHNEYFGIEVLVEKLKRLFFEHLKKFLPSIYLGLKLKIKECQEVLETFGTDYLMYHNETDKHTFTISLINQFSDCVERLFSSKMAKLEDNITSHKIRMHAIDFLQKYSKDYKPSEKANNEDIIRILKQTEGDRLPGFPESEVIFSLLSEEIILLQDEVKEYLDEINSLSSTALKNILTKMFSRFPKLLDRTEELLNVFIEEVIYYLFRILRRLNISLILLQK